MWQRYKEIFYGLLFGLGASAIDVSMHASMEQQGFLSELLRPNPAMVAYRISFIVFGLALGWLLWRKNKAERDFRRLAETLERLQRGVRQSAVLIHANMQLLLTRNDLHLPPDAENMIRDAYERMREIRALLEQKLAPIKTA